MKKLITAVAFMLCFSNSAFADNKAKTITVINDIKKVEKPIEFVKTNLVLFKVNKSDLTPYSKTQLKSIADNYLKHKEKRAMAIEVIGHTDKTGSLKYNLDLSTDRALAAANYLIDNGVDVNDLSINAVAYQNPSSGERNSLIERSAEITLKTF